MTELSLVICTRDRADRLRRTLEAVDEIESSRDWEVVVVENACTDHTPEVVSKFVDRSSVPARRVVEPEPGLSRARNAGCSATRGDVIAFTDDDCYPGSEFVDATLSVFDSHDVAFMGGRVLRYDPADADFSVRKGAAARLLPPHTFPRTGFVIGANMAVRRKVWDRLGGFDEDLGAGTPFPAEDIEICARASHHGWRGGYFPGPVVYHHHGRKPGRDVERLHRVYDRGRGAYYAKVVLDMPTLRRQCMKWWYWDLDIARPGQTRREILGAAHYLLRRGLAGITEMLP